MTSAPVDAFLEASRELVGVAARSLVQIEDVVTLSQYRALVVLWERSRSTTGELAADLGIHPSTATRLGDRLERKGLIERRHSGRDRREVELGLSPAGRDLVERVMAARRKELRRILRAVPADELAAAVDALRAFSAAARRLPQPPTTTAGWW